MFGIMQGRLIQAPPGELQWFPGNNWLDEFPLASSLGFKFIEMFAEQDHNDANPLWNDSGLIAIKNSVSENGLEIYSLCNNYIVSHGLLGGRDAMEQTVRLIGQAGHLGVKILVLPFFESSAISNSNFQDYIPLIREIADEAAKLDITLCLETELEGRDFLDFLDRISHQQVAAVYDTGNRVAFGGDPAADIRLLGNRIQHVHIKDKNKNADNVLLGTGLVNFHEVFSALSDIDYDRAYTFETTRGKEPVRTGTHNIQFTRFFLEEAFSKA